MGIDGLNCSSGFWGRKHEFECFFHGFQWNLENFFFVSWFSFLFYEYLLFFVRSVFLSFSSTVTRKPSMNSQFQWLSWQQSTRLVHFSGLLRLDQIRCGNRLEYWDFFRIRSGFSITRPPEHSVSGNRSVPSVAEARPVDSDNPREHHPQKAEFWCENQGSSENLTERHDRGQENTRFFE